MTPVEVNQYLGLPYVEGGYGPEGYNCWGLLATLQKRYFGIDMPFVPIGDEEKSLQIVKTLLETRLWLQQDDPVHGDSVLLRGGNDCHVGLYLDLDNGGVLHSLEGIGVVFTARKHLGREGFARPKFYRYNVQRQHHPTP